MFRSHQDLVRVPKKQEKPKTRLVYGCDLCPKGGWITENDVEIHRKDAHFLTMLDYRHKYKDRFCTVCMKLLESNEELIRHIKSKHLYSSPDAQRVERQIYICNECTNVFFNKDLLVTHMLYIHSTNNNIDRKNTSFTCPKCFRDYRLNSIWYHFQQHEIPSVSLCDICLENFPNRTELADHICTHSGHFICEPCGYNGTKLLNYKKHVEEHALRPFKTFQIPPGLISRVFSKHKYEYCQPRYNVHNALRGLNLPKLIHICTLCREICVKKREAKRHLWQDHFFESKKKKKHLCMCGESFFNNVLLKQHVFKMKDFKFHAPIEVDSSDHLQQQGMGSTSATVDSDDDPDTIDWGTSVSVPTHAESQNMAEESKTIIQIITDESQTITKKMTEEAQTITHIIHTHVYEHNEGEQITGDLIMETDEIVKNENVVKKVVLSNKMEFEISGKNIASMVIGEESTQKCKKENHMEPYET